MRWYPQSPQLGRLGPAACSSSGKAPVKKEPLWERGLLLHWSLRKKPGPAQKECFPFEIILSLAEMLFLQTRRHAQEWSFSLSGPAVIAVGLSRLNPTPPGADGLNVSFDPSSIFQPAWPYTGTHPCLCKDSLCHRRVGLARYIPWLTNHQGCDLEKSAFRDFPMYQGNMLSHEVGRGQWTAGESQGVNRLIPETQQDLSLLPGDSTNILQSEGKDSGKEGDLNFLSKTVSLESFQE